MKDRDIGKSRRGVVVNKAGKLQWSGKERNIPENWRPGTFWGSGPDKQSALKMAMGYVSRYWEAVGFSVELSQPDA